MADTFSPNYNLVLPEVGGSTDTWGGKLNQNFSTLDTQLKANADAAAQKSLVLTAGDGLSGGGDLSANRSFAVDSTVVRTTRTITAGNGLTGGGDFSANRTFTLGTPGTITASSTNSTTASSHTHQITISPGDINAYTKGETDTAIADYVLNTTNGASGYPRVAGAALSSALQEYLVLSSGLHTHGGVVGRGNGAFVVDDTSSRSSWRDPEGYAGVTLYNSTGRTVTIRVRVYFHAATDDPVGFRLVRSSDEVQVSSASTTVPRNTNGQVTMDVSCGPDEAHFFALQGAILSGSGLDDLYFRGITAYLLAFF